MNKTQKAILITSVVLLVVWIALITPSSAGYGYPGHGGYRPGGFSFFYWGGSNYYYPGAASARTGSVSGPRASGRGLKGGK